jgi:hypothetical protein
MTTTFAHPETCECHACLVADMNAHLIATHGETQGRALIAKLDADPAARAKAIAERTRYAKPGQRCGRGVVRKVSEKQVALIRRLLAERDTTSLVRLPGSEDIASMSLKGATDLIDRLFACPAKKGPAAMNTADLATEKQVNYALSLSTRKGVPAPAREVVAKMTRAQISSVIDQLLSRPDAPEATVRIRETGKRALQEATGGKGITEDGMYQAPDGTVYKVQFAKNGSGNLYAKKLTIDEDGNGTFAYAPGAITTLRPDWKMTLVQAQAFGKLYGICCRCGRDLTDEESIAAGIGPICAGKF